MPKSSGRSIFRTGTYFLIAYFGGILELVESAKGLRDWQKSNMMAEAVTFQAFLQAGTLDQALHLVCYSQLMKSGIKYVSSWNRLLVVEKWFFLPHDSASSLCYTPQLLDFAVNQSSSPEQQETMQLPGEGSLASPDCWHLSVGTGLGRAKSGMMQAAGACSWDLWRRIRGKKIGGDWDSDNEKLIHLPNWAS